MSQERMRAREAAQRALFCHQMMRYWTEAGCPRAAADCNRDRGEWANIARYWAKRAARVEAK